jgi:hypothetical protein
VVASCSNIFSFFSRYVKKQPHFDHHPRVTGPVSNILLLLFIKCNLRKVLVRYINFTTHKNLCCGNFVRMTYSKRKTRVRWQHCRMQITYIVRKILQSTYTMCLQKYFENGILFTKMYTFLMNSHNFLHRNRNLDPFSKLFILLQVCLFSNFFELFFVLYLSISLVFALAYLKR